MTVIAADVDLSIAEWLNAAELLRVLEITAQMHLRLTQPGHARCSTHDCMQATFHMVGLPMGGTTNGWV